MYHLDSNESICEDRRKPMTKSLWWELVFAFPIGKRVEPLDKLKLNQQNVGKVFQGNRGTNISFQCFILIFPIVKWRNHCNFTLSNKSFHVCIGEIQVFLDSRTQILKKSLLYVSPAFTHLLYSPNANILEIIDFTPTLHNTQNLSAISLFICHRLSLISRTFHCHNCSQNTGNEASWNLISKWLAKNRQSVQVSTSTDSWRN
jgi:hypothetical protein